MAVPWWRQCRRLSSGCTSAALLENVRRFDSRPMSAAASCLGRPSWCSSSRESAVSVAACIGTQSPVAIQEGHSYSRAVSRTLCVAVWMTSRVEQGMLWESGNRIKNSLVFDFCSLLMLSNVKRHATCWGRVVGLSIGAARIKVKTFAYWHRRPRPCHFIW